MDVTTQAMKILFNRMVTLEDLRGRAHASKAGSSINYGGAPKRGQGLFIIPSRFARLSQIAIVSLPHVPYSPALEFMTGDQTMRRACAIGLAGLLVCAAGARAEDKQPPIEGY